MLKHCLSKAAHLSYDYDKDVISTCIYYWFYLPYQIVSVHWTKAYFHRMMNFIWETKKVYHVYALLLYTDIPVENNWHVNMNFAYQFVGNRILLSLH